MDSGRLIIALVACVAVLVGWTFLSNTFFPPPPKVEAPAKQEPAKPAAQAPAPQATGEALPAQGRKVTVATPLYTAVLNVNGGLIERFVLARYKESIAADSANIDMTGPAARAKAPMGLMLNGAPTWTGQWTFEGQDVTLRPGESKTLVLKGQMPGFAVERRLTFGADTYLIQEEVSVTNQGPVALAGKVAYTAASQGLSAKDDKYNPTRIAYHAKGLEETTDRGDLEKTGVRYSGKLDFGAIDSNYFILAVIPKAENVALKGGISGDVFSLEVEESQTFEPGVPRTLACSYFIGPLERDLLATMPGNLANAVDFGWFDFLAKPLLWVLNACNKYVHNYGVAIILLTILIKIIFWPLSQKSYKSMEQMKKLQPMIQKLREKHKNDKQRMNQEIMSLYKTFKVNPAGGCLPMIVQIPVFFGLYKALLGAIELRHSPFITHVPFTDLVWLADLSAKDPFYVTPLIMGATMFIQQKMTPSSADPTQAKIMMALPIVFTFIFLNFPAGLVVYWLVNNVLSIGQQWWMMRKA